MEVKQLNGLKEGGGVISIFVTLCTLLSNKYCKFRFECISYKAIYMQLAPGSLRDAVALTVKLDFDRLNKIWHKRQRWHSVKTRD